MCAGVQTGRRDGLTVPDRVLPSCALTLPRAADNRLLAALPISDRRRIVSGCETVELALAELLYSPWKPLDFIYFPISSFISLIMPTGDSAAFEVGLVGNEGMLGTALALNADISAERATVHGAGTALRMDATTLHRELRRSEALRGEIDRYVHVRMGQLAQAAICAQFHLLEARVACRLLTTQDRAGANAFNITQEALASRLGVRRAGITQAASSLKRRRLIGYSRGIITVLDRRGLMTASCRCYQADRDFHDRFTEKRRARSG
jgi:CRP-like cAMP-binding protein